MFSTVPSYHFIIRDGCLSQIIDVKSSKKRLAWMGILVMKFTDAKHDAKHDGKGTKPSENGRRRQEPQRR
jgi:hypothetical protein